MSNGRQTTQGLVCPRSHQVGRMDGNTFHGSGRFGTYFLNDNFPKTGLGRTLQSNGHVPYLVEGGARGVAGKDVCYGFEGDGTTHGAAVALTHNLDYDNAFVGQ